MIPIAKAHACGNDFLYVPAAALEAGGVDPVGLALRACDRHRGIGADGLIVFWPTDAGARMRLINSDGSRAEVSGNGVRALAALLARERGWRAAFDTGRELTVDTEAGPKVLTLLDEEGGVRFAFRASMGQPRDIQHVSLDVAGERLEAIRLDMGNPQCVALGPLDEARWARLGRALQRHPAFPEAVNFELAKVLSRERIRILIWERGVGPTHSSGTGSCAAAVAAITAGATDQVLNVEAPGGTQRVEWTADGVFLTGSAEVICEGQWVGDANLTGRISGH